MYQFIDVWIVKQAFEMADFSDESLGCLVILAVCSHDSRRICSVRPINFLVFEHLLQNFYSSDTLEADAVVVVYFEVDSEAEPDSFH